LHRIDTVTISTAMGMFVKRLEESCAEHRLRFMLSEFGSFISHAVMVEVTTNDSDSPALSFMENYRHMDSLKRPAVAVFKDVDSQPGRGASFGEGTSVLHRKSGAVEMIVDGAVRDPEGLRERRFPVMAWGAVPGHDRFTPTSQCAACGSGRAVYRKVTSTTECASRGNTPMRFCDSPRICWRGRKNVTYVCPL
jgi:regulator of RNase E activity RraA